MIERKSYIQHTFFETLEQNFVSRPEQMAFYSDETSERMTYARLEHITGQIYAYLSNHQIGREDFVLICMPRGTAAMAVMVGVIRAGAAFVLCESNFPPERVDYIVRDCGCKLKIDEDVYAKMLATDYRDGFAAPEDHDAVYAVYTSGTTGNPKGVLHEYGNLRQCIDSSNYEGTHLFQPGERVALLSPFHFVATIQVALNALIRGSSLYIVSNAVIHNFRSLMDHLTREKINAMFMTPSMARFFKEMPASLHTLILSGEPAGGCYLPGPVNYNVHSMSETGFLTSVYRIQETMEMAPIGKPQFPSQVYILDEEGNECPDGVVGEYCFENPYVRGYIHLDAMTEKAFRNGIFHTGDLGRREKNGNIVLLGRNDDMVKIHGSRIEPAEIEERLKNVLGLSQVVVRGFADPEFNCVCAYYLKGDPKVETAEQMIGQREMLDRKLGERLSPYMIPAYYIGLEAFPMSPNGKLLRKNLPAPQRKSKITKEVVTLKSGNNETENHGIETSGNTKQAELEEQICRVMANILKLDSVDPEDDFYAIGGDSLNASLLLAQPEMASLTIADLYEYRTPARLASMIQSCKYQVNTSNQTAEQEDEEARHQTWPLGIEEKVVVDFQAQAPEATMWNLSALIAMKPEISAEKLQIAVEKVMRNHPAFSTGLCKAKNVDLRKIESRLYYDPDLFLPPVIVDIPEEALLSKVPSLIQPFTRLWNCPLYRVVIYRCESRCYLFFDIFHLIADGTSIAVFLDEISRCMVDEQLTLPRDFYYLNRKAEQQLVGSPRWEKAKQYYDHFDLQQYCSSVTEYRPNDATGTDAAKGVCEGILDAEELMLENSPIVKRLGRGNFYLLSMGLAIHALTSRQQVLIQSVLNARDTERKQNVFGLLYRGMPVLFDFASEKTLEQICEETLEGARASMAYCFYPALNLDLSMYTTALLYQKGIYENERFRMLMDHIVELPETEASDCFCDAFIQEDASGIHLSIEYQSGLFSQKEISQLLYTFKAAAGKLMQIKNPLDEISIGSFINQLSS